MRKRFVSWAAVSSLPQAKKISLEDQLKTNREHIERAGGNLIAELVVPGESRSIVLFEEACATMEAYAELKRLIETHAFDVFIFLDRSRLGRISSLIMAVVELCHQAGIVTYSTESPPSNLDNVASSYVDNLIGAVESVTAQEEVNKIRRRHEMGMKDRVLRGDFPGAVPYGWKVVYETDDSKKPRKTIVIDDEVRPVIEDFVALYAVNGRSLGAIGQYFRDKGYKPPKGGNWHRGSVTSLLNRIWRYAGYVELNKRKDSKREYLRAKSKWPAIITEKQAHAVEEERRRRAGERRSVMSMHRFSGLIVCGICGKKMRGANAWSYSDDKKTRYRRYTYACRDSLGRVMHYRSVIGAKIVERGVHDAIVFVQDEDNRAAVLGDIASHLAKIQSSIDLTSSALQKNEAAQLRADDVYISGDMTIERYKRKNEELKLQRASLLAEMTRLEEALLNEEHASQRGERLKELAAMGLEMLKLEDIPTANAWFRKHIKITVNNQAAGDQPRIRVDYI